jgi:N-acetylglutamate synthase-like GNAT family acetyltransferase
MQVKYRWATARDFPEISDIDHTIYGNLSYSTKDLITLFKKHQKEPNITIGKVATINDVIAGYVIYNYEEDEIVIDRLVVDPWHQQKGIGGQLLERCINKEAQISRTIIWAYDDNLVSHLFLKNKGFVAIEVKKNVTDSKDIYVFSKPSPFRPVK